MVLQLAHHQHNPRLLAYGFLGTALMCVAYLAFLYDPVDMIIAAKLSLSNGTYAFELWQKPPYDIYINVYIFNVTNTEEFLRGEEKLRFEQIGPFVYQEYLENTKAQFNDNGTLSFTPRRTVIFRREMSIADPKTTIVNVPNLALLGITSALHKSSIFTNLAVTQITTYLKSEPMLNLTVHDFLWGYEDPMIRLASTILPSWINFPTLGLLDRMFDDGDNVVTMNIDPTIKPSANPLLTEEERHRPYAVQLWNGSPGLSHWGYTDGPDAHQNPKNTRCNMIEGAYDGTLFPRKIAPNTTFRVYRKAFCRTLPIDYDHTGESSDGFRSLFYKMAENAFDTPSNNPDNKCYCSEDTCLPKGLSDLTSCYYGIPAAVSQPHFYNGDPSLVEAIDGLNPNKEDHDTVILIHQDMGVPLWARSRVQTNLVVKETKYNRKTKPYNNIVLPIFWTELALDGIPPEIKILISLVEVAPKLQTAAIIIFAIIGFGLLMWSVTRIFWVTPGYRRDNMSDFTTLNIDYKAVKIIPMKPYEDVFDRESNI